MDNLRCSREASVLVSPFKEGKPASPFCADVPCLLTPHVPYTTCIWWSERRSLDENFAVGQHGHKGLVRGAATPD